MHYTENKFSLGDSTDPLSQILKKSIHFVTFDKFPSSNKLLNKVTGGHTKLVKNMSTSLHRFKTEHNQNRVIVTLAL